MQLLFLRLVPLEVIPLLISAVGFLLILQLVRLNVALRLLLCLALIPVILPFSRALVLQATSTLPGWVAFPLSLLAFLLLFFVILPLTLLMLLQAVMRVFLGKEATDEAIGDLAAWWMRHIFRDGSRMLIRGMFFPFLVLRRLLRLP